MTSKAEGFAAIPNWMIRDEDEFDVYDLAVYTALASHTGPGGVRPSQTTLAREARCSERKVRDVIRHLEGVGVVEVTRHRRRSGQGKVSSLSNGYVLHPHGHLAEDEESVTAVKQPAPHAGSFVKQPAPEGRATGTAQQITPLIEEEPVKKNPVAPRTRGSRIPDKFFVTGGMRVWASEHAPLVDVDRSTLRFVNYWRAKTGKDATKLDWERTWQNWLLKDQEDQERRPGVKQTTVDHGREVDRILRERAASEHLAVSA